MSRRQQREKWKCRQRVVRQLRFDQTKDDKNDRCASEQVDVDLVALTPQFFREHRQLDRPRKKAGEDRDEIKRQQKEINPQRVGAVTFHRAKRTTNHVPPDSNSQKLTVGLNQGWN